MKCPACNEGELKDGIFKEEQLGIYLGEYKGQKCTSCGEIFFDSESTQKIIEKAKEKGIFGIEAKTKIAKSGNSLAVRIPKKIAEFLKLKEGKEVRLSPQGKKIVIET